MAEQRTSSNQSLSSQLPQEKQCSRCKCFKSVSEFYRKNSRPASQCKACHQEICRAWKKVNPDVGKEYDKRNRIEAISYYSNGQNLCACCGENHLEFLTVDHIDGGGTAHKKQIYHHTYRWLRKYKYPSGFRVLCFNCNLGRAIKGYCPHERE
ncbi:MAG TPA: hypothetical protein VEZ40_18675 [Pyrinomonadaceae bacterium]|nr:hypothetical protein [Pyrinomonadaceae bacterium]